MFGQVLKGMAKQPWSRNKVVNHPNKAQQFGATQLVEADWGTNETHQNINIHVLTYFTFLSCNELLYKFMLRTLIVFNLFTEGSPIRIHIHLVFRQHIQCCLFLSLCVIVLQLLGKCCHTSMQKFCYFTASYRREDGRMMKRLNKQLLEKLQKKLEFEEIQW